MKLRTKIKVKNYFIDYTSPKIHKYKHEKFYMNRETFNHENIGKKVEASPQIKKEELGQKSKKERQKLKRTKNCSRAKKKKAKMASSKKVARGNKLKKRSKKQF